MLGSSSKINNTNLDVDFQINDLICFKTFYTTGYQSP